MHLLQKLPTDWAEVVSSGYLKGMADVEIRRELKITKGLWDALYNDVESHSFREIVNIGREYAQAWWLTKGREALHDKSFNANLWHMNMKNRYGWSDKTTIETKDVAEMSRDELLASLEKLGPRLKKLGLMKD